MLWIYLLQGKGLEQLFQDIDRKSVRNSSGWIVISINAHGIIV